VTAWLTLQGSNALHIHRDQISTTKNKLIGASSMLLCLVPIVGNVTNIPIPLHFGDIGTVRFENPELKHLQVGTINELVYREK